jgi:DNA-binding NarL/FixJ family response regulator
VERRPRRPPSPQLTRLAYLWLERVMTRSVVIASGDRLWADAASAHIDGEPGWEVAGTVPDGLQALAAVSRSSPDAVLVIGNLPRLGPAALSRQIRRRWPETTVVLMGEASSEYAVSLGIGVRSEEVLTALASPPPGPTEKPAEAPNGVLLGRLTRREREVLKLLGEGRGMPEIARALGLSPHTIRTHMGNLYSKLGAHTRLDVVRFAASHGLVSTEDESDRPG